MSDAGGLPPPVPALPAHAMVNLELRVLDRRPDGRHEIETTMQAVSLHDLLFVETAGATSLVGGYGEADLVLKAQRMLEEAAGRRLPARFRLVKRIPAGAGLSGGSSDAAAALRGLARLHRLECDLAPVAERVGADVPFFLRGGAAVARGTGERLSPAPGADGWMALAWPGFAISTADVYRCWDRVGGEGGNHLTRAAAAVEPRLRAFAARLGPGWRMTGSGSAFFLCRQTRAEAAAAVQGFDCWTAVVRPVGAWAP